MCLAYAPFIYMEIITRCLENLGVLQMVCSTGAARVEPVGRGVLGECLLQMFLIYGGDISVTSIHAQTDLWVDVLVLLDNTAERAQGDRTGRKLKALSAMLRAYDYRPYPELVALVRLMARDARYSSRSYSEFYRKTLTLLREAGL